MRARSALVAASSRLGASSVCRLVGAAIMAVRRRAAVATRIGGEAQPPAPVASSGTGMSCGSSPRLKPAEHALRAHGVEDVARRCHVRSTVHHSCSPCTRCVALARPERRLLAPEREQVGVERSSCAPGSRVRCFDQSSLQRSNVSSACGSELRRPCRSPRTPASARRAPPRRASGSPWLDEVQEGRRLAVLLAHEQQRHVRRQQHQRRREPLLLGRHAASRAARRSARLPTWSWFCDADDEALAAARRSPAAPCVRPRCGE